MDQLTCPASTSVSVEPSPRRRQRLQRSERLHSASSGDNGQYASWEALVRESFGHIAWPIKITSWELTVDGVDVVPTR